MDAGEARRVTVVLDPASDEHHCSIWDNAGWRRVRGDYGVAVGASSRDLRLTGSLRID